MFNKTEIVNAQLPGVIMNEFIPLPSNEIRVDFSSDRDNRALKAAEQYKNYVVLLVPDYNANIASKNAYYKRGVVAKIVLNMTSPNGVRRVKIQTIVRCDIKGFVEDGTGLIVDFTTVPSFSSDLTKEDATFDLVRKFVTENAIDTSLSKDNINILNKSLTRDEFTDILAFTIHLDKNSKLRYLMETDTTIRLGYVLEDLYKQKMFKDLEIKIENSVKKSINESQKEYYLREKMKAIQEELGEKAKRETEIDEIRQKIKDAGMPKSIEEKANIELNRYVSMPGSSPESGVIRKYLDFMIDLPWSRQSIDSEDINLAKEELDKDHYGLNLVKERILEYLAVKIMNHKNPQTILCLVGPPGVGKTSLAKSIAKALNKSFVKQALGGVKDESEIRGHRRTYLGALPGRILQAMVKAGTNNPVFLLDEIDKMSNDYKGDPTSAMLEVLDSEQNRYFSDHYLEEPYDLSNVFFIATANYLENIPAPLRDRLEIVEVSSYTEYEKFEIAKRHLIKKQLKNNGLDEAFFSISDQAIYKIIQEYTREAGVRELERMIGTIIRKAIKNILMNHAERIDIDVDNIEEYLGKPKYMHNTAEDLDQIGVVTGLAYTQFGGDTLSVEVTHYKGDGRLLLTGKLGDVMKESAQAALSYVRTNSEKFGIDPKVFKESDIHIHVPEGAIPKDGPSAGVTIATGIISSLTSKKVDHSLGMTGEITLRGRVLPIGGLREKSIAAHRSGLKSILIPKENVKDLEDIPDSVKNSLSIIPVETIDDVVKYAIKESF
jgi:endopeptidase La